MFLRPLAVSEEGVDFVDLEEVAENRKPPWARRESFRASIFEEKNHDVTNKKDQGRIYDKSRGKQQVQNARHCAVPAGSDVALGCG